MRLGGFVINNNFALFFCPEAVRDVRSVTASCPSSAVAVATATEDGDPVNSELMRLSIHERHQSRTDGILENLSSLCSEIFGTNLRKSSGNLRGAQAEFTRDGALSEARNLAI